MLSLREKNRLVDTNNSANFSGMVEHRQRPEFTKELAWWALLFLFVIFGILFSLFVIILAVDTGSSLSKNFKFRSFVGTHSFGYDPDFKGMHRPLYHLSPPLNWMNDPCSPHYNPTDGLYHVFYQYSASPFWLPPLFWAEATSPDLVQWTDSGIVLKPTDWFDDKSVFTGSGMLYNASLDIAKSPASRFMVSAYTGVTKLPISWSLPYFPGSETQNIIYSHDNGKSWYRSMSNPVIDKPPSEWNVTGFRDPFIFQNKEMDLILSSFNSDSSSSENYYMLLGSGLRDYGGMILLYTSNDLLHWTPMPLPFFHNSADSKTNKFYSGCKNFSLGYNYEVPILKFLGEVEGKSMYLLVFGIEKPDIHEAVYLVGYLNVKNASLEQAIRPLENFGSQFITFEALTCGLFDHGIAYATNSVTYPQGWDKTKTILISWINEDWSAEDLLREGVSGSMTLPRDISLVQRVDHQNQKYPDISIKPFETAVELRKNASHVFQKSPMEDHKPDIYQNIQISEQKKLPLKYWPLDNVPPSRNALEITAHVSIKTSKRSECEDAVGIVLQHSSNIWKEYTVIYLSASSNNLVISRKMSSHMNYGANDTDLLIQDGMKHRKSFPSLLKFEIDLRIFLDNSVIEVFLDDRIAVSTRIYPAYDSLKVDGLKNATASVGVFYSDEAVNHKAFVPKIFDINVWYDIPSTDRSETISLASAPGNIEKTFSRYSSEFSYHLLIAGAFIISVASIVLVKWLPTKNASYEMVTSSSPL